MCAVDVCGCGCVATHRLRFIGQCGQMQGASVPSKCGRLRAVGAKRRAYYEPLIRVRKIGSRKMVSFRLGFFVFPALFLLTTFLQSVAEDVPSFLLS